MFCIGYLMRQVLSKIYYKVTCKVVSVYDCIYVSLKYLGYSLQQTGIINL